MTFTVETTDRLDVVDVTDEVAAAVPDDLERGTATIFVQHTTAGVLVNEAEPRLLRDIESFLEKVVPDADYEHDAIDDNADAHLRATLLGESATIPVTDGDLALGTWQSVLLVDCDGPRTRTIDVVTARGE